MKRILLITHGKFAEGIIDSLKIITGQDYSIASICVSEADANEDIQAKIDDFLQSCNKTDIKIIITDIPGGSTTTNAFRYINSKANTFVITGLNLPMLLEVVMGECEENPEQFFRTLADQSKESIKFLNDLLPIT